MLFSSRFTTLLFFISFTILATLSTHAQNYAWAKQIGNTGQDVGYKIETDPSGNVFVVGGFEGTTDFDPNAGVTNLTAAGGQDIFFAKYDANGNLLWAKRIGNALNDFAYDLALGNGGSIYLTGYFEGTMDFDPGAGNVNLVSAGGLDMFIAKYDGSGGFLWAKGIGGNSTDLGYKISIDSSDNAYITGQFSSTVDFNPGAGVANQVAVGMSDIFIAKFDASGNYVWAFGIGSPLADGGNDIVLDDLGNIYLAGIISGSADFDPSANVDMIAFNANSDGFLAKYDASGNYLWAKNIGSSLFDNCSGIALDETGNVIITGLFQSSLDFDFGVGSAVLTSVGATDIYFAKYDENGNYIWANQIGSADNDLSNEIALDADQNIYLTGSYGGTSGLSADFDPSVGVDIHTPVGDIDIFLAKYDANGNYIWAKSFGGLYSDKAFGLTIDLYGSAYITGYFSDVADFDPSAGSANLTPLGGYDIFIAKYVSCTVAPSNPGSITGNSTMCLGSTNAYSIESVSNAVLYSWTYPTDWIGASTTNTISLHAGALSGTISVTANNACGSSSVAALPVLVNLPPEAPGEIAGSTALCVGEGSEYSVDPVSGATFYTWTLPEGWTGSSSFYNISPNSTLTGGTISVTASNSCGTSAASSLNITIYPLTSVTLNLTTDFMCLNASPITLSGGSPVGGTYTGLGVSGQIFTPVSVGSSFVYYSYSDVNSCSYTASDNMIVDACLVVQEQEKQGGMSLYPSPTTGFFTLKYPNHNVQSGDMLILNLLGELVYSRKVNSGLNQFDISGLDAGIYLVQLMLGNERYMQKIVKE